MTLKIDPIRAFADNYIWAIHQPGGASVTVVDPGDARPVLKWLEQHDKSLDAILVTHGHSDHVGGIPDLLQAFPDIPVYGPKRENISTVRIACGEGDRVDLPSIDAGFGVMDVPGHTLGHIAYYGHGVLFCGDTVFACGCGRVFSGTFEQLAQSLMRIATLPRETLLYCAHEYTLDNIGFAKWVEPTNPALLAREIEVLEKAEKGIPTVPSTLDIELQTNPFLRLGEPDVVAVAQRHMPEPTDDPIAVFTALRQWKDREYD